MKKIIAILSVLLVAACVFAAVGDPDVAAAKDSIRVSTKIIPVEPTFALETVGNTSTSVITSSNTDDHAGDGTVLGKIQYSTLVEGETANTLPTATGYKEDWVSANYLLDNDVTVTFAIYQRNVAISDYTYKLTASTTALAYVSGSATSSNTTGTQVFAVEDATPAIVANEAAITDADKLTLSASDNVLTAKYAGRVNYNGGTDKDLLIGSFDVKWLKNGLAEVGKYSADVTLTITTN